MKKNTKFLLILLFLIILLYLLNQYFFIESFTNEQLKINGHWCGLFCNLNRLIYFLVIHPDTRKIDYNVLAGTNTNHKPFIGEGVEIFSKLFEPYDEGLEIDNVVDATDHTGMLITHKEAFNFYNEHRYKLEPYGSAYKKYIRLLPHIQLKLDNLIKTMRGDYDQVIGIFVRSNALASEQPNGQMPTREEYLEAVRNIDTQNKKTIYYLRIDNEDDLAFYKASLSPTYETTIQRSPNNNGDAPHITSEFKSLEELEDTYLEIALLSNCEYLIHCVSNMATASLYMNMNQISICISK